MRPYEIVLIAQANLEDGAIDAVLDRATGLIEAKGGVVNRIDRWGRRAFAYEVHHQHEGYYVLMEVTAEPSGLDEVDRNLRIADEVIRHKIVRIPDHVAGRDAPRRPVDDDVEPADATAGGSEQ